MATADQIKRIIQSHYENNSERFNSMVLQLAAYEATKGHSSLARDLKKLVDTSKSEKKILQFKNNLSDLIVNTQSKNRLSHLILEPETKERIERILLEFRNRDKLRKHGLNNRKKILLAGPSGTGKTMTASVLAGELGLPFCTIMMDKMVTKYMGETSAKLRQIFETITENQGVYLFDEFDAIGSERGMDNDVGEMRRVLNTFLQLIEQDESDGLIIAATNSVNILDQALFRRFDDIIYYHLPYDHEIKTIIKNRIGLFISNELNVDSLLADCKELSHAEITRACDDSVKEAILNDKEYVTTKDLAKSIKQRLTIYHNNTRGN